MKIIEGPNVDLIEPFPLNQISRAVGWLHCYKTWVTTDDGPQTPEDIEKCLLAMFQSPNVRSWGIIDKNNKINSKHEAPIVGFLILEHNGMRNSYCHVATTRRAWGSRLVDEAVAIGMKQVFDDTPQLLRISAFIVKNNAPARALMERMGLRFEGVFPDYLMRDGAPAALAHYGITRRAWEEQNAQQMQAEAAENTFQEFTA